MLIQCFKLLTVAFVFGSLTLSIGHGQGITNKDAPRLQSYLVVSLVEATSEFYRAAELLAKRHQAEILHAKSASVENVLDELKKRQPAYVAFVLDPAELDINLVNRLFVLSTQVDSDRFADFAWGVITGRDGVAAEKLVKASDPSQTKDSPSIAMFGIGGPISRSTTSKAAWPLRTGSVSVTNFLAKGDTDENRDAPFIAEAMPKLNQANIILLASHGYPDGLVAGPKAGDLKSVDLAGRVLLNIACYTGVTGDWYDQDYQNMKVRRKSVNPADSFCLQAIDCGVAGYFAYASPRPAGPTMMGDALLIAASGKPLGELFRENQQSIVLAHLLSGDNQINSEPLVDGATLANDRTPGKVVRQFSTGGILFGDPAYKPFAAKPDSDARVVDVQEQADRIAVSMKTTSQIFHFFASDQINYWDGTSAALRMECDVPLGDRFVEKIRIKSVPEGVADYRWVAAIEEVSGQRRLRFKLNFAQPTDMTQLVAMSTKGLKAKFEILTSGKNNSANSVDESESKGIYRGKSDDTR
jgi:hypothetical protein